MEKIKDLQKGDLLIMKAIGKIKVLSIAKNYIRVKQLDFSNIIAKLYFGKETELNSVGISRLNP